jgi:hypothetical protein
MVRNGLRSLGVKFECIADLIGCGTGDFADFDEPRVDKFPV